MGADFTRHKGPVCCAQYLPPGEALALPMKDPVRGVPSAGMARDARVHERRNMEINGLQVELVRKNIKHIHLRVYPPDGRVRVSVPRRVNDATVRAMVAPRLQWIRRQQARVVREGRRVKRELVTGETHWFAGRAYKLQVIEVDAVPSVGLRDGTLELHVRPGSDEAKRRAVLEAWYRKSFKAKLSPLLAHWEPRVGVRVAECRARRMKTRWGSCNIAARRIWLNLELAKMPPEHLEWILVHELVHLLEPGHGKRFQGLMDQFLPDWRSRRDALNRSPFLEEEEAMSASRGPICLYCRASCPFTRAARCASVCPIPSTAGRKASASRVKSAARPRPPCSTAPISPRTNGPRPWSL